MNLVLIGLRGSGKTTIGRLVAARSSRPFVDLDDLTARELGARSAGEAWARHGETAFRAAEARALAGVLRRGGQVIALGGGTPTAPGAAEQLSEERRSGRVRIVYLRAGADVLRARLAETDLSNRPSLTGADPLVEIEAVLAARDPAYARLADHVMEAGGETAEQVAELIARRAGL